MRFFPLLSLLLAICFFSCKKPQLASHNKEAFTHLRKELTPDLGVIFTKKIILDHDGKELFSFIDKTEFFSPKDPERTKIEYIPKSWIYGLTTAHMEDVLSPDKKWVVLKMGNIDGLVYGKTKDILKFVKENRFEGRFNFEFDYEDEETGDRLLTDAIGWEAPATFVFYVVNRDDDRKPDPEKEIYKINLETGEFVYPPQANPVVKPVLRKAVLE